LYYLQAYATRKHLATKKFPGSEGPAALEGTSPSPYNHWWGITTALPSLLEAKLMSAVLEQPKRVSEEKRTVTPEDLLRMPKEEQRRYELVDGQLVERSMAATSSAVAANLITTLNLHVMKSRAGLVFGSDQGYQCFPHRPNNVRYPDISFIAKPRLSPQLAEGHIRIAPDLVVEVLSPNDLARDVSQRIQDYLRAGVRLVWVVDPEGRTVQVYRQGRQGVILSEADELDGDDVLPGFRVAVRDLFRPLELLQPSETQQQQTTDASATPAS
jgi:Uma2 family endonuclease